MLLHEQADRILAVEPGESARFFDGIFGAAHVLDADGVAVAVGDDQLGKLFGRVHAAQRAQHQLAGALLHDAAGHFEMLGEDGAANVLDGQPERGELVRVENDVDGAGAAAGEEHAADAGHLGEDFLDVALGDLGHFAHVAAAGDTDGHDGGGVEIELVDQGRFDALGQQLHD